MKCPRLADLPPAPANRVGWPWTEEAPSLPVNMPDGSPCPRVSIVTPSYNQGQFLEETIRSVLLQGYPDLEYFVIDGGSTDYSVQIIQKYAGWLAGWVSEKDKGQSDAINKGLARTSGNIIAWLNSDDVYLPGCVSDIVSIFNQYPDAGMIYGNLEYIDENSKKMGDFPYMTWTFSDQLTQKMVVFQQAAFWRREVMDSVGMLRNDLHYAMDFEFWIRIGRRYKIVSLNRILAQYRKSSVNKGETQRAAWGPEFIKIIDDLYAEPDLPPEILMLKREAYAGAYFYGAERFQRTSTFKARIWLLKALLCNPYSLYSNGWWRTYVKAFLGQRIYEWCRSIKSKLR
jgi:glycosyltransferase involved in cell wall biosynthesis